MSESTNDMTDLADIDTTGPVRVPLTPQIISALRRCPTEAEREAMADRLEAFQARGASENDEADPTLPYEMVDLDGNIRVALRAIADIVALLDAPEPSMEEVFSKMADDWTRVVELTAGHKQKMLDAGFRDDVAQAAALQVHYATVRAASVDEDQ